MSGVNFAGDDLRLGLERIERLEEEKKGIADDIKDVYAEYKSKGFDVKTMRELIKLRKMDANERREREALLDTYKAALGMLDGTPLGKWAVKKLSKQDDDEDAQQQPDVVEKPDGEPAEPVPPPPTVEEARAMGRAAAQAGQPVTSNPFPARDERRAAWDEEWCKALGSDGMDIPDALKPAPKPKKGAGDEGKPAGGGE